MRTVFALVVVACLAAIAAAQIPAKCVSPKEWEGRALIRDTRRGHSEAVYARYTYDELNQRKARYDEVEVNRTTSYYHVIELFKEKTYYEINLKTKDCRKGTIDYPFITHSVVDNATFQGEYILGSNAVADAGVDITVWSHKFVNGSQTAYWNGQFTRVSCFPIVTTVDTSDNHHWTESFVDITLGIHDPNVFVPPTNCK